jgi:solute carrier family 35 (UDP-galactose transporter), member B1
MLLGFENRSMSMALHALGIYVFFLIYGIYSEKLSTTLYGGLKYDCVLFPTMLQSLGGFIMGNVIMRHQSIPREPRGGFVMSMYLVLAACSLASIYVNFITLRYLSYPTLIIAKSCKLIPVALMNFLIFRERLEARKCLSLALISLSVLSFTFFSDGKKADAGLSATGIAILTGSLLFDGTTNALQDNLIKRSGISSFHMMHYVNLLRFCLSSLLLLCTNGLSHSLAFFSTSPGIAIDLLLYSTFNVFGQIVVYSMLQTHGTLALTTVTVTRKMFSILLSLVIFGHKVTKAQLLSVLGVLMLIGLEMREPKRAKTPARLRQ